MAIAIDTNILLDIAANDPRFGRAAVDALVKAAESTVVVICPIVYAELAVFFPTDGALDSFLAHLTVRVDTLTTATLTDAGRAWNRYVRTRGTQVQCPHCGERFTTQCPSCARPVSWRQRVISDFLIGAHAARQAHALLTRDARTYRTYFPQLPLRLPDGL